MALGSFGGYVWAAFTIRGTQGSQVLLCGLGVETLGVNVCRVLSSHPFLSDHGQVLQRSGACLHQGIQRGLCQGQRDERVRLSPS